jgi:RNA polymerase sigma-70 factor (ECF subfamily)
LGGFRRLKNLLRHRGQTHEDAEDLIQEAFLRLHNFMTAGNEVQQPEAFLVRTALNLAIDTRRRDRRDRMIPRPVEELMLTDMSPSGRSVSPRSCSWRFSG